MQIERGPFTSFVSSTRTIRRKLAGNVTARALPLALVLGLLSNAAVPARKAKANPADKPQASGPSQSTPIALSIDEEFLVNVNSDVDTITIFRALPH